MRNTVSYIVIAVLLCAVMALLLIALSYPTLYCQRAPDGTELIPLYLSPWGSSIKDVRLNWFSALRLPFIGLCLALLFTALLPDKLAGAANADSSGAGLCEGYSGILQGLLLIDAAQLSLNPMCTYLCINNVATAIIICVLTALGAAVVAMSLIQFRRVAKPLCASDETVWSMLLDYGWDNCKKRHKLIIAFTAVFMIVLVLPSLGV